MRFISIFVVTLFLTVSFSNAQDKPNIILIMVDDMGYSDLGCYGGEIETPNIDKLAEGGMRFTSFYNCAKCETSRRTLLSGVYHTEVTGKGPDRIVTIPEALALGGYQNFMVGKWHIFDTPIKRGFDRFFGMLGGACNFFTGEGTNGKWSFKLDEQEYKIPENFYTTSAFTDYAVKFIAERDKSKPFFMYAAYNAPHYPLQAPKEAVMKYRGKYKGGWAKLRKERFERMKKMGILPKDQKLSAPEPDVRDWDSLTDKERDRQDLLMATYAAMIDIVDQNVGRIVGKLKDEKIFDDTLIILLSDNGACPFDRTKPQTLKNNYMPWDDRSFYCYTKEWANACNTPFRKYKQNQNEGGISTAMVAHWPAGMKKTGSFDRDRAHLVDLHATFTDLAGVDYPKKYKGNEIVPAPGLPLTKAFSGQKRPLHDELYFIFYRKYSALRRGDWKIVDQKYLYDISKDRIESNDLSGKEAEKFEDMKKRWQQLNNDYSGIKRNLKTNKQKAKTGSKR